MSESESQIQQKIRMAAMLKTNKGFTLLELLMVMLLSSIIMSGVISTYMIQQKVYLLQEELTAVQQNLRVGMYMLERDIRMIGFDSGGGGQGLISATSTSIEFTKQDIKEEDGEKKLVEMFVGYELYDASDGNKKLGRRYYEYAGGTDTKNQPIAENIEALDFVYLDKDGNDADINGDGELTKDETKDEMNKVRRIEITMVARTDRQDFDYVDSTVYKNKLGKVIFAKPDHYHRRVSTANIECRNLLVNAAASSED